MTIKSKFKKFVECPKAVKGYYLGINPNHIMTFSQMKSFIEGDLKTYIDVGANVGQLVKTAKWFYPNVRIVAFEPNSNIYKEDGQFFEIGLSDKKEESIFYKNNNCNAWSTLHKPIESHSPDFEGIEEFEEIKVKLDRFDNLKVKIESPCLLKIDTEGHELEVLKGFGDRLKEVDVIQLEYLFRDYLTNKCKMSDIMLLLESYGFNGFVQVNPRWVNGILTFCDMIFFRIKEK